MTKQKRMLTEEVKSLKYLFDAQQLHMRAVQRSKKIGLATIYRFLNEMEKEGTIHTFVCNNKKIHSTNKFIHAHFKCEICGRIKHVNLKNLDFLDEFKGNVCHFQIEMTGRCADCSQ